jgi:hypothetical protein
VPVVRVCHNGGSMGFPPRNQVIPVTKRGATQGWTSAATRRNRQFLWSVRCQDLGQNGHSFTLTVANCPPTAQAWATLRRSFVKRLEREGLIRLHWLTEWQRRGVPHLHGCVWFSSGVQHHDGTTVLHHWLSVAKEYGAQFQGQDTKPISNAVGWLKYLAKHADRGVWNYQRSSASIPDGWRLSTGRMWGHTGIWPTDAPVKIVIDDAGGYAYRRIIQRWRLANARVDPDLIKRRSRVLSARKLLRGKDRASSSVRGSAEWLPLPWQRTVLLHLAASGHQFTWAVDEFESDTQTFPGFEVQSQVERD